MARRGCLAVGAGRAHHSGTSSVPSVPSHPSPALTVWSNRRRRYWTVPRLLQYAVILALAGLAVYVVEGKTEELSGASVYLEDLRWYWLVVAAVAELGSIVAFAALQRCLLSAGDVDIDTGPLVGITFAATQSRTPCRPARSGAPSSPSASFATGAPVTSSPAGLWWERPSCPSSSSSGSPGSVWPSRVAPGAPSTWSG